MAIKLTIGNFAAVIVWVGISRAWTTHLLSEVPDTERR